MTKSYNKFHFWLYLFFTFVVATLLAIVSFTIHDLPQIDTANLGEWWRQQQNIITYNPLRSLTQERAWKEIIIEIDDIHISFDEVENIPYSASVQVVDGMEGDIEFENTKDQLIIRQKHPNTASLPDFVKYDLRIEGANFAQTTVKVKSKGSYISANTLFKQLEVNDENSCELFLSGDRTYPMTIKAASGQAQLDFHHWNASVSFQNVTDFFVTEPLKEKLGNGLESEHGLKFGQGRDQISVSFDEEGFLMLDDEGDFN